MTEASANLREVWTKIEVQPLEQLADRDTRARVIASKEARFEGTFRQKSSEEAAPLKPTHQPPCNLGK